MNRRTALLLSILLGGLVPESLHAQSGGRRSAKTRDRSLEPASSFRDDSDAAAADDGAAPFSSEAGFQWRRYDISRYTRIANSQANPQKALIDWIFKRTGTADWHGDKV